MEGEETLLTSSEAAAYMGLSERRCRQLVVERVVPWQDTTSDGFVRFKQSVLDAAMTHSRVLALRLPPDERLRKLLFGGEEPDQP